MPITLTPEQLFEQATDNFPYPSLQPTSITMGELPETFNDGQFEYSEEFTFEAGKLLEDELTAGGWIELHQDQGDEQPTLSAFFGVARNGDWEQGRILPETLAIQGYYNLDSQTWEFDLDTF